MSTQPLIDDDVIFPAKVDSESVVDVLFDRQARPDVWRVYVDMVDRLQTEIDINANFGLSDISQETVEWIGQQVVYDMLHSIRRLK